MKYLLLIYEDEAPYEDGVDASVHAEYAAFGQSMRGRLSPDKRLS